MTWPFRQTGGPLLSMYMKSRKVFPGAGELTQSVNPCYGSVRTRVQSLIPKSAAAAAASSSSSSSLFSLILFLGNGGNVELQSEQVRGAQGSSGLLNIDILLRGNNSLDHSHLDHWIQPQLLFPPFYFTLFSYLLDALEGLFVFMAPTQ